MSRAEVAEILASTGYPVVYYEWPDGAEPVFPCIRYVDGGSDDFYADNRNYAVIETWDVTLVTEWKDENAESVLESAFADAGVTWVRYGDRYIRDERLNHVDYIFMLPR